MRAAPRPGAAAARYQHRSAPSTSGRRTVFAMAAAPKTGQQTVSDELKQEALNHFFPPGAKCSPTTGGVNNVVNYVDTADGKRYVLRIYNNGNNTDRVRREHEILQQLSRQKLSFQVPRTVPTLKTGESFVVLSTGTSACVFEIIPGTLAKTTSPEEVGRATGELCSAMGRISLADKTGLAPPYWDLYKVHHAVTRDLFYQDAASNPAHGVCREAMDFLTEQIRQMEEKLVGFKALDLPSQTIHGDLHYDNVMVQGDSVSGLLDFEFCAYDWRAMELAVALSKYVSEADPAALIARFVTGYAAGGSPLSEKEISALPDLISLRILSNVVFFTGRAAAKEDSIESLTSRAGAYAKRVRWINDNKQLIVDAVKSKMMAPAAAAAAASPRRA